MSHKDRDSNYRRLFAEELRLAEAAKQAAVDQSLSLEQLYPQHQELAAQYEKLLRTTIKLSRISDIQGKTLKEQEQEIQTAHENLKHLEKLRQQLIADISHELGTPMVAVQGYVKALLDGVIQPEDKYLRLIYDRVLKVNHLIKDLFLLSTYQANRNHFDHQQIDIDHFVSSVAEKYAPECERGGIVLEMEAEEEPLRPKDEVMIVWADPVRLDQVFENLIQNALKYTGAGGTIRLRSEFQPKYEGARLGHWFFKITDTGIGIDDDEASFVFDRFFRSKQAKGIPGTGLGLAITKEIIQKHGGEIGVTSKPGEGTTFFFLIPAELINTCDGKSRSKILGG
ncbi:MULTISPECIES: cell wall metabolism sensor histidine kinase WalK [unclassified Paenibacillus]|uniref:sensor histidine kinase n=1 Tax=unclassified Paenibacillus TaxID=185978 RepID=UPI00115FF5F0|nr:MULTISPECIES: HAMP domain-containing sensor histidine kinase [unclassified Paenibacillus]